MELKDTIPGMLSEDCRDQLRAEHQQASIRLEKLERILEDWEPDDPDEAGPSLLQEQARVMSAYLTILEDRAEAEGISL